MNNETKMNNGPKPRRIAIVGAGISGLGAAWALARHPDRFEFELFESTDHIGGNAVTVEVPQNDGTSIPFDIAVTAFNPEAYPHYVLLLQQYGVTALPSRLSYSVHYDGGVYAHDLDTALKAELQPEIDKFQALLRRLKRYPGLLDTRSKVRLALNPYNYISMRRLLDLNHISMEFRYKILKPLFVNFVLASALFDMPAALFAQYLHFYDVEHSSPMTTWEGGTANLYRRMSASFSDKIHLKRAVRKILRDGRGVIIRDEFGREERFDDVILACNANQALMLLDSPSFFERFLLGSVRYDSELHNHAIVHTDESVLPVDETQALEIRTNFVKHYGGRPDNYEITYIMHNQQPWAKRSDKPCLVTYNPIHPIDEHKILKRFWYQHVVHDVRHVTMTTHMFRLIQGKKHTWYCGAHTTVNSQEFAFVSGLAVARQLGVDYPFSDPKAQSWFNFWGTTMFGRRFRKVK